MAHFTSPEITEQARTNACFSLIRNDKSYLYLLSLDNKCHNNFFRDDAKNFSGALGF